MLNRSNFLTEFYSLVRVPSDLVPHHDTLHQPLCIQSWVIVAHLYCGELTQILALQEKDTVSIRHLSDSLLGFRALSPLGMATGFCLSLQTPHHFHLQVNLSAAWWRKATGIIRHHRASPHYVWLPASNGLNSHINRRSHGSTHAQLSDCSTCKTVFQECCNNNFTLKKVYDVITCYCRWTPNIK